MLTAAKLYWSTTDPWPIHICANNSQYCVPTCVNWYTLSLPLVSPQYTKADINKSNYKPDGCMHKVLCVHERGGKGRMKGRGVEREKREKGGKGGLTIPAVCEAVDTISVSL